MGYRKTALTCLLASTLIGAKPPSGSVNPQVAYVILTGPGFELRVSDENGTNLTTIYKSAAPIRFDLGPRSQHRIVMTDGSRTLKLLTYDVTGSGAFTNIQIRDLYTSTKFLNGPDFSPDGSKIAFGAEETLKVYDLGTDTVTDWTTTSYVWDPSWYKGGAAIAFIEPTNGGPSANLYEITAAGATPTLLTTQRNIDMVDSARTNPDALVLSYNDASGNALIGLWANGSFSQPNLTNRSVAFKGTLSCDDTKLTYGAPGSNGQTVWYIRENGLDRLYTKTPRVNWTQFWPTC